MAGPSALGAGGLSIYFPPTEELLDEDHASVESAQAWSGCLSGYLGAGDELPADRRASFAGDGGTEVVFDEDGSVRVTCRGSTTSRT